MPGNDSRDSKLIPAAATWGMIFGLLTTGGCWLDNPIDHSQRPICGDADGGTTDPCADAAGVCTSFAGIVLEDGGVCVAPAAPDGGADAADAGPAVQSIRCGFCNG